MHPGSNIESGMDSSCAFCREPTPDSATASLALIQKRVDTGDAEAIYCLGNKYYFGLLGLQQDKSRAIQLFREAANHGSVKSYYDLGTMYDIGEGGLEKDEAMAVYHCELAAKAGHPEARSHLGVMEARNSNFDRSLKHWMMAAKMGHDGSLKNIQMLHKKGIATKDDYSLALVGYQQAVEEMKSDQRVKAKAYFQEHTRSE